MSLERKLERAKQQIAILERMVETKTRELYLEQRELQESHERLQSLLQTIIHAVIVTDKEHHITGMNRAAEQLLGITQFDVSGTRLFEALTIERIDMPGVPLLNTAFLGQSEGLLLSAGGTTTPVFVSVSQSRDHNQIFEGVVVVLADLTHQKDLERSLLQAQRLEAVGQLAAGLAHEINTPIQYVRDNTSFIREEFEQMKTFLREAILFTEVPPEQLEQAQNSLRKLAEQCDLHYLIEEIPTAALQTIQGAEQVATIVRSMKLFSHPGTSERILTDLNATIESSITLSTNEWKYVADITFQPDRSLPLISCYPGELGQAILNILVNASHAIAEATNDGTNGKGHITIKTELLADGRGVSLRIEDTGSGIPESILSKIYDPFFTTKAPGKGTGQGLAMVLATVETHGGAIDVTSTQGKGSEFNITLPIEPNGVNKTNQL